MDLPISVLSSLPQVREIKRTATDDNGNATGVYVLHIRWDDYKLGNKRNSFGVTLDVYNETDASDEDVITTPSGQRFYLSACGCQNDLVKAHFPDYAHFIKWHLMMADGPMHYIANTVYHANCCNLEAARRSAMWPEADLEQLQNADALLARLPDLMIRFKADVEALGFTY